MSGKVEAKASVGGGASVNASVDTTDQLDSLIDDLMGMTPNAKVEAKVEATPPKADVNADAKIKAEVKVQPKVEVQAGAKASADMDDILADLETMSKPKVEAKVEVKPKKPDVQAKVEVKPKAEAKVDVDLKVDVKPKAEVSVSVGGSSGKKEPSICVACQKAVTGKYYNCQDKLFHVECLVCTDCKKPITSYNVAGEKFLCTECFRLLNPHKVCAKCSKDIIGSSVVACGSSWHADCFTCAHCDKVIKDDYVEHEGKVYCAEAAGPCYKLALGKVCSVCKQPLEANYLGVLGKQYHRACFCCKGCSKPFETLEFFPINEEPYCEPCALKEQQQADQQK